MGRPSEEEGSVKKRKEAIVTGRFHPLSSHVPSKSYDVPTLHVAGTVSSGLVLSKLPSQVPFESHDVPTSHVVGTVSHVAMGSAWTEGMESLSRCGRPDALPRSGLGDTLPRFGCASASLK